MKKEDIDFLRDLQKELNTQTNDGNADPVYWGVMERKLEPVPEGVGDAYNLCRRWSHLLLIGGG